MKNKIDTLRVIIGILILALIISTVAPSALQGRDPLPSSSGTYYGQ
ncbi:MAG TPA: hypothetical protein VK186_14705 [Candidatus Deferrimicrobium sp.]|nr:hypothetical protein [Candidatus Deferrimicrobium sp.]